MNESASTVRRQAADTLRTAFQYDPGSGIDPVMELIGSLLEDGTGDVLSIPDAPVTTEQWLTWNNLVLGHRRAVERMMTRELNRELLTLPEDQEAMRTWAARLLLNILDRFGML